MRRRRRRRLLLSLASVVVLLHTDAHQYHRLCIMTSAVTGPLLNRKLLPRVENTFQNISFDDRCLYLLKSKLLSKYSLTTTTFFFCWSHVRQRLASLPASAHCLLFKGLLLLLLVDRGFEFVDPFSDNLYCIHAVVCACVCESSIPRIFTMI